MPTYVYECSTCNQVFEIEQRITEDALKDCQCGSLGTMKRVIQPVGISFKGSGFYVNDSKGTNPAAAPAVKTETTETKVEDTPIPAAPAATPLPASVDTTPAK